MNVNMNMFFMMTGKNIMYFFFNLINLISFLNDLFLNFFILLKLINNFFFNL